MRDDAFRRAIEAGRVVEGYGRIGHGEIERAGVGRRRGQEAVGADHPVGRDGDGRLAGIAFGHHTLVARELHDPAQHFDEGAGDRQVRPGGLGRDVEQDNRALSARGTSDKRRAIAQCRPGALHDVGIGFSQHLPRHGHVLWRCQAGKAAGFRQAGDGLRLGPGERSAERTLTGAQTDRQQAVILAGGSHARPGETHERSAAFHEGGELLACLVRDNADIGHDDDGRFLLDQFGNRGIKLGLGRFHDIGKFAERAPDVEKRREQRLGAVGIGRGQQADAAAALVVIQRAGGACLARTVDEDGGEIVAQFEGHGKGCGGGVGRGIEGGAGLGDPSATAV